MQSLDKKNRNKGILEVHQRTIVVCKSETANDLRERCVRVFHMMQLLRGVGTERAWELEGRTETAETLLYINTFVSRLLAGEYSTP